jgi:hypothetical protein
VISLVQKGRDFSEEDQRHSDRGRSPKESSSRGSIPKEENGPFPLMSKGEILQDTRYNKYAEHK